MQLVLACAHHFVQSYARRVQPGHPGHFQSGESRLKKNCFEAGAELLGHQTVQHESDGSINQCQQIHDVAEQRVAVGEKALLEDAAEQSENALREFSDQEEQQHGDQQHCGAIGSFFASRWTVHKQVIFG